MLTNLSCCQKVFTHTDTPVIGRIRQDLITRENNFKLS